MTIAFSARCNDCICDRFIGLKKPVGNNLSSRITPVVCKALFNSALLSGAEELYGVPCKYIIQTCGNFCKCEDIFMISVDTSSRNNNQISSSFGNVFCCKARKGAFLEKLGGDGVRLDVDDDILGGTFH